jgi:hypothetical protein
LSTGKCLTQSLQKIEQRLAEPEAWKTNQGADYLALAVGYDSRKQKTKAEAAAAKARVAFQAREGFIPVYAPQLLSPFPQPAEVPEIAVCPWEIDWDDLPSLVRNTRSGKIMRLVRPSFVHNWEGTREMCLWPFYIDERPVTVAEMQAVLKREDYACSVLPQQNKEQYVCGSISAEYLKATSTSLPIAMEAFAAWLQANNWQPTLWGNVEECWRKRLERLDFILRYRENPEFHWEDVLSVEVMSRFPHIDSYLYKAEIAFGKTSESAVDSYDEFLTGQWFQNTKPKRSAVEQLKKKHFPVWSEFHGPMEVELFLLHLAGSLSLNTQEKERILNAAPTLSRFQIDELVKVFVEERAKFKELAIKHLDDIHKLITKVIWEWMDILHVVDFSLVTALDAVSPWDIVLDEYKRMRESAPGEGETLPCVRTVKPIFCRSDMEDLEPLSEH